jgi:hypothetical protein
MYCIIYIIKIVPILLLFLVETPLDTTRYLYLIVEYFMNFSENVSVVFNDSDKFVNLPKEC